MVGEIRKIGNARNVANVESTVGVLDERIIQEPFDGRDFGNFEICDFVYANVFFEFVFFAVDRYDYGNFHSAESHRIFGNNARIDGSFESCVVGRQGDRLAFAAVTENFNDREIRRYSGGRTFFRHYGITAVESDFFDGQSGVNHYGKSLFERTDLRRNSNVACLNARDYAACGNRCDGIVGRSEFRSVKRACVCGIRKLKRCAGVNFVFSSVVSDIEFGYVVSCGNVRN